MSATVRLSSKLPGDDDINGVDDTVEDLLAEPRTIRLGLVWYDVAKITSETDTGDDVPTIRLRRFEPLATLKDVPPDLAKVIAKVIEERTGTVALPINVYDGAEHEVTD
jgi:hypothetical protein